MPFSSFFLSHIPPLRMEGFLISQSGRNCLLLCPSPSLGGIHFILSWDKAAKELQGRKPIYDYLSGCTEMYLKIVPPVYLEAALYILIPDYPPELVPWGLTLFSWLHCNVLEGQIETFHIISIPTACNKHYLVRHILLAVWSR